MEEIRQMREDIKSELAIGRQENREDIKDLHSKIDKRFFMLNEKFDVVSKEVTTHKAHLKTFVAMVMIGFTALSGWIASVFGR
jgi:hypothetical protein